MLNLSSDDASTTVRLWSLTDDALVEDGTEPDSLTVLTRWGELVVSTDSSVAAEALRRMAFGPVTLRNTLPPADAPEGAGAVQVLEKVLAQIGCVVVHSLGLPDGQGPLLSVVPEVAEPDFQPVPVPPASPVRLSRFATMRPEGGQLLLESPGAPHRVLLCRPAARALAAALVVAATPGELAAVTGIPLPVVADLVSFLVAAGVVLVGGPDGCFAEDTDRGLRGWAHHELHFHRRSRSRQGARPADGGTDGPPPVTRPMPAGERFALYRPDPAELAATDPTLTELLETDHLCPEISTDELTAEQVGELLFRSARIRSTGPAHIPMTPAGEGHDASQRPYFNIACLYELELYLTLNRCAGLPRGIYHYDPLGHRLTLMDTDADHVHAMLEIAKVAAGSTRQPAGLLTITARIERLSWLLPGASYAVALMHCGVLQETLYLSAKAMGLAMHAVPADAIDVVDPLLGLRWPAEVGIGECILEPATAS